MEYENQYLQSKYECLVFDLDDTLYPLSSGLAAACRQNIEDFMLQKLGIEQHKVFDMATLLYKAYGTTMAGLRAIGYHFDYDEYHSFVHGRLPYENLKPDPVLRGHLLSLPFRKVLFTNGDNIHATRVLSRLGLEDCFEMIICFETLNPIHNNTDDNDASNLNIPITKTCDIVDYFSNSNDETQLPHSPIVCKPSEVSFKQAFKIANINPQRTFFFDDSIRNIQSGKSMGLHTVLVGTCHKVQGADYALESIHNIKEALPELWEATNNSERIAHPDKMAIETFVEA